MTVCNECGGTVIEYDTAAGNGFCVGCGTVVEESVIVNEIGFGEAGNGAAVVQGSFVAQGATRARMAGPYGNRGSNESREQTIANAQKKIQSIATALRLSEQVCLASTRLYTLAVEHKFTKGRKSLNVVAVCLYVACRQKETKTYMLIDFSDLLQVNVFELGHTYLQLVQTLNLRLPLVDPSHYISRFAALLEFGEETHKVASDAVRLVQRFDRDWLTRGRRPAGICGAALLLAARMNNFRRSVEEIVQVVKIADTTLKKRLEEFKSTPSGGLTVGDFRRVWLEGEVDPPAFTRGREREEREREDREARERGEGVGGVGGEDDDDGDEGEGGKKGKKKKAKGKAKEKTKKGRKGKRKREDSESSENDEADPTSPIPQQQPHAHHPFDPALLNDGILAGALEVPPLLPPPAPPGVDSTNPNGDVDVDLANIDPVLLGETISTALNAHAQQLQNGDGEGGLVGAEGSSTQPAPSPTLHAPSSALPPPSQPLQHPLAATATVPPSQPTAPAPTAPPEPPESSTATLVDDTLSQVLAAEVSTFLHMKEGAALVQALDEAEGRRREAVDARRASRVRARGGGNRNSNGGGNGEGNLGEEGRGENGGEGREGRGEDNGDDEGEDEEDDLADLDEDELDRFILSEEEVRVKERVWVELNREYLEALAAKGDPSEAEARAKSRKRRKTTTKPRDASTAAGGSAAESVKNLLKKNPKYSKRINYEALKDLFVDGDGAGVGSPSSGAGVFSGGSMGMGGGATQGSSFQQMVRGLRGDGKDDDGLYVLPEDERGQSLAPGGFGSNDVNGRLGEREDGKGDDEGMLVIVEEDEGGVPMIPRPGQGVGTGTGIGMGIGQGKRDEKDDGDEDMDEDEEEEDAEGDVVGGWEDGYEQEV